MKLRLPAFNCWTEVSRSNDGKIALLDRKNALSRYTYVKCLYAGALWVRKELRIPSMLSTEREAKRSLNDRMWGGQNFVSQSLGHSDPASE